MKKFEKGFWQKKKQGTSEIAGKWHVLVSWKTENKKQNNPKARKARVGEVALWAPPTLSLPKPKSAPPPPKQKKPKTKQKMTTQNQKGVSCQNLFYVCWIFLWNQRAQENTIEWASQQTLLKKPKLDQNVAGHIWGNCTYFYLIVEFSVSILGGGILRVLMDTKNPNISQNPCFPYCLCMCSKKKFVDNFSTRMVCKAQSLQLFNKNMFYEVGGQQSAKTKTHNISLCTTNCLKPV